jgi:hypothetical protein
MVPTPAHLAVFPLLERLEHRAPSPRRRLEEVAGRRSTQPIPIFRRHSNL